MTNGEELINLPKPGTVTIPLLIDTINLLMGLHSSGGVQWKQHWDKRIRPMQAMTFGITN